MDRHKPAKKQPTARTLELLRKLEWPAGVVERWKPGFRDGQVIPYGTRVDFLGCIDIIALDGKPGSLGIQACAGSTLQARLKKALEVPELKDWLGAGNRFEVWGWRQIWVIGKGGTTKLRQWRARAMPVILVEGMLLWDADYEPGAKGGDAVCGISTTQGRSESDHPSSNAAPAGGDSPGPDVLDLMEALRQSLKETQPPAECGLFEKEG